jgi:membrane-bound metal-dependent hydrolase YbcI (DUF457 family)
MVMGPTHALSGATAALAGIAWYSAAVAPVHPTVAIMGTVVAAGAALAPDIDSGRSTVVNSFGIFGRIFHIIANSLSVAVYNLTKTRREEAKSDGHRTLFHTTAVALIAGVVTFLATLPTNIVELYGREYTLGQLNAIILLSIYINLALGGLLEHQIKKARKKYGPYLLMVGSLALAALIALFIPSPEDSTFGLEIPGFGGTYAYLGIGVAFGWFIHLLGDAITKMGVPMAWPIKVRGKRWYDVALPAFMRIRADGTFEKVILLPALTLSTTVLMVYTIIAYV